MRDMDELPPDQRAVLALVLTQQRSYGEVASMLGIPEKSVRERAHAALDALADTAQGSPASAQSSRNGSDHGEPQPNAPTVAPGLTTPAPSSPTNPTPGLTTPAPSGPTNPAASLATPAPNTLTTPAPSGLHASSLQARVQGAGGSKLGGAILLGAIVVGVVVAVIVLSGGGKGSGAQTPSHASSRTSGTTATQGIQPSSGSSGSTGAASAAHLDSRFSLRPTEPAGRASGQGLVVSERNARAFYVTAQGLPRSSGFFYAVWLYNSQSDSYPLGRSNVGSNGHLEGGGPLTAPHLASFHKLVITRETNEHPVAPGPIVLSGPFALH